MASRLTNLQLQNRLTSKEQELEELRSLYAAATQISANLSLQDTLDPIALTIVDTLGSNGCSISIWQRPRYYRAQTSRAKNAAGPNDRRSRQPGQE